MPFSLKPRWRFVGKAVYEEFKRSKLYKLASIVTGVLFLLEFLGMFGFNIPAPSVSWRNAAVFLTLLVVALLLVVEAVYRFYRRTVSDLYAETQKRILIVSRLAQVAGQGTQIDQLYLDKEDEVPKEIFQNWLGSLRTALQDISPSAVSDFTNDHPEELDIVPESRHVWFLFLRERLSVWIGHQANLVKQAKANHDQLGR